MAALSGGRPPLGGAGNATPVAARVTAAPPPARHGRSQSTPAGNITLSGGRGSSCRVTVRVNQPVEGVPLTPFCFVQDERGQRVASTDERVVFTWTRSPDMWTCCCYQCQLGRGCASADDPMKSHGRVAVQCTTCAKAGAPVAPSLFCSAKCMKKYWSTHVHACHPPKPADSEAKRPELRRDPLEDADRWLIDDVESLPPVTRDSTEWVEVARGSRYVPTHADVGHKLRLQVTATLPNGTTSERTETKWVQAVAPPPPVRKLLTRAAAPSHVRVIDNNLGFRIISYNVLAEIYATQSQYPYCPQWALSFEYRRKLLMAELKKYDPDVMCLQEVQADQFNASLYHDLLAMGYEGLFKAKTRASMGREGRIDGCALFYRTSRFTLAEKYVIEFNDAAEATYKGKTPQLQAQREPLLKRLKRDNVAQVVVLEMTTGLDGARLSTPMRLCVANTHLSWNPEYDDVKLWQTHMLTKELEKFILARSLPLVLCGDFNSDTNSAVYKLLASNRMDAPSRFTGLAPDELPRDPYSILHSKMSHNVVLDSAHRTFSGEDPEFTNYTADFVGCLDHAWITTDRLMVKSLLEIPSRHVLTSFSQTALPNPQFPSDHVALVFDMLPCVPVPPGSQQAGQFASGAQRTSGAGAGAGAGSGPPAANIGGSMTSTPMLAGWHRQPAPQM